MSSSDDEAEAQRSVYADAGTLTPEILNAALDKLWNPEPEGRWLKMLCNMCGEPVDISGGDLADAARDHYRLMHPDTEWPPLEPWLSP